MLQSGACFEESYIETTLNGKLFNISLPNTSTARNGVLPMVLDALCANVDSFGTSSLEIKIAVIGDITTEQNVTLVCQLPWNRHTGKASQVGLAWLEGSSAKRRRAVYAYGERAALIECIFRRTRKERSSCKSFLVS